MLTTFAQRGAELVNSTAAGIVSTCSLAAMMVAAVVVDPAASIIVIAAVAVLGLVLRPLRAAVGARHAAPRRRGSTSRRRSARPRSWAWRCTCSMCNRERQNASSI